MVNVIYVIIINDLFHHEINILIFSNLIQGLSDINNFNIISLSKNTFYSKHGQWTKLLNKTESKYREIA